LVRAESKCGVSQECIATNDCNSFKEEKQKMEDLRGTAGFKSQLNKLRSLVCNRAERKVCCDGTSSKDDDVTDEDSPSYRPSQEEERCGLEGSHSGFIVGGEDTRLGQFPFLALLGKPSKKKPGKTYWFCGGALINKWYVLTAAHCGPKVESVRLGEWKVVDPDSYTNSTDEPGKCYYYNEKSETECRQKCPLCKTGNATIDCDSSGGGRFELCSEPVQDIPVAKVKIHPGYGKTVLGSAINDIMLIKLSRPAEFNQFAKPVCLPSSDLNRYGEPDSAVFDNNKASVVGWGKTYEAKDDDIKIVSTAVQQNLVMPALSNADCLAKWKSLGHDLSGYVRPDQQVCAGGELGKDSCNGDSGGPLMARKDDLSPWQIVGIVSFGTPQCARGAPAVFTRVTHYRQWIRDNMV